MASWNENGLAKTGPIVRCIGIFVFLLLCIVNLSCSRQTGNEPDINAGINGNSPPFITAVSIIPEDPNRETLLNVLVQSQDPEGDPITFDYHWIMNEREMSGGEGGIFKHENMKKGDLIQVKVVPNDGKVKGNAFLSAPVKILNSAPVIQEVWIEPRVAYLNDHLQAHVKSIDLDGDLTYFTYRWEKNGKLLEDENGEVLDRGRFKKGDSMVVVVTPDDREVLGIPQKSPPLRISNSPPTIVSSPPTSTDGNTYLYQVKATDPDNDPIVFSLKSGPKKMAIDKNTGTLRWEIRKEDKGTYSIEIEATDNEGAKSLQQYTLTVEIR